MTAEDFTVDEAIDYIREQFETFDEKSPEMQAQLHAAAKALKNLIAMAETRNHEIDNAAQARKRDTAQKRKAYRDSVIPTWCKENFVPGMVVKVNANSHEKLRQIESIGRFTLVGRHCHYDRIRILDSGRFTSSLRHGAYITNHLLTNVQGVVTHIDESGYPVFVPIMELVEGKQKLRNNNE